MSLHPVKFYFPFQIDAGTSTSFVIEDEIEIASFILQPALRFYNTINTGTSDLVITQLLDLGFGDDPLNSGTVTTTLLNAIGLAAGSTQDYQFLTQIDLDTDITTRHTVTVTNNSTAQEVVRFVLTGFTEIDSILPGGSVVIKSST